MIRNGYIDFISSQDISGWTYKGRSGNFPELRCSDSRYEIVECTFFERPDLTGVELAVGFRAKLKSIFNLSDAESVSFSSIIDDEKLDLLFSEAHRSAAKIEKATKEILANNADLNQIATPSIVSFLKKFNSSSHAWPNKVKKRKLAVISQCNDDGAWFPYFYQYYSNIVGASSIFIVTPKPQSFAKYKLGGVISMEGFPYDDASRSELISGFSTGLLGLFEWILVCDVDEILIPHPMSNRSFLEMLDNIPGETSISRGVDIVEMDGDEKFDMSQAVLSQGQYGIPNSALCKPHLARVPTKWSVGFHYNDRSPKFEQKNEGFLTLHLKYACAAVRMEVSGIVQSTTYSDEFIEQYSKASVLVERHPAYQVAHKSFDGINGRSFIDFEEAHIANFEFSTSSHMWEAKYMFGYFLVDLHKRD